MNVEIELEGNTVDRAMLIGFMAVSADAPNDFKGAEVEEDVLTLTFDTEPSAGGFAEVLRALGGSAKGDRPMRVRAPDAFKGQTTVPAKAAGAERWDCPRCNLPVMAGHNDQQGVLFGICKACGDADRGTAGSGSAVRPAVGSRVQPPSSSTSSSTASAPIAAAPLTSSTPAPSSSAPAPTILQLPVVAGFARLPHPPPRDGLLAVLASGELAWSANNSWHTTEGRIPPLG